MATNTMNEIPVIEPMKPVARCGVSNCGRVLYDHSSSEVAQCNYSLCPMRKEAWKQAFWAKGRG